MQKFPIDKKDPSPLREAFDSLIALLHNMSAQLPVGERNTLIEQVFPAFFCTDGVFEGTIELDIVSMIKNHRALQKPRLFAFECEPDSDISGDKPFWVIFSADSYTDLETQFDMIRKNNIEAYKEEVYRLLMVDKRVALTAIPLNPE